jgi:GNAT superfamily N-acetyltransferase
MHLNWIRESSPRWDEGKQRVVGGAPAGVFDMGDPEPGQILGGEWWRVEEDGEVLAYGWMDTVWGDGEVLLAVDADQHGRGIGAFVLKQLDREAAARGINVLYNVVRPSHPDAQRVSVWLNAHGFYPDEGGVLKRHVSR